MIVSYCNQYFRTSKTDGIDRYFYKLDKSDVKVHTSPVDSLDIGDGAISDYHCGVIQPGNKMSFRKKYCFCAQSLESKFADDCPPMKYCGKLMQTKPSS